MLKPVRKSTLCMQFVGMALSCAALVVGTEAAVAIAVHQTESEKTMSEHPYVGMWVTDDDQVRHELLPNGRYDEARGRRESAYQGRYEVRGNYIQYWDDTGFTADGNFVDDDTLHHGGMILRRRR